MDTLKNWTARRSGGRITINGTDHLERQCRVPNIDTIVINSGKVVATDKNGLTLHLLA